MEHQWAIDAVRVSAAAAVLLYASIRDLKERKVPNAPWMLLSLAGIVLLPVQIVGDGKNLAYLAVLIPILAILADVYWDGKEGSWMAKYGPPVKYATAILAVIVLGYFWVDKTYFQYLLAVPVLMLFIVVLYMTDIIRGGADAKALLSLAILFPTYPSLWGFPMLHDGSGSGQLFFPFAFVILVNAAIMTALLPIVFLSKNLASRDRRFPQALLGYKIDAAGIKGKHVWLMERIEDGKHVVYARPRHTEDLDAEVDRLSKAGIARIWITPKIPFIVPMLLSLVFSVVVGNLVFLLGSF